MTITDPFIRRPVLALVVNLVIIIAGLQAIGTLNVRQYPRSDNAVVTITTVYVGASADLVRGFVTVPLERAIAAADGIDYIKSQSALGLSTISARLKLNYDPIKALSEIGAPAAIIKTGARFFFGVIKWRNIFHIVGIRDSEDRNRSANDQAICSRHSCIFLGVAARDHDARSDLHLTQGVAACALLVRLLVFVLGKDVWIDHDS